MKTVTIRNIPDDLYAIISRVAQRNHRSIQQQLLAQLEKFRVLDKESPVIKAQEIRNRLAGRPLGDTLKEIREERNR